MCWQDFERGRIAWTPNTGAWASIGLIGERYRRIGTTTPLGYPTGPETCPNGVCTQRFEGGEIVWYPGQVEARTVYGAIYHKWISPSTEGDSVRERVGLPIADEICDAGHHTCSQNFSTDRASIQWYDDLGTYFIRGAIFGRWAQLGANGSTIGRPTMDERCGLNGGGCFQQFSLENGAIYYQASFGANDVRGTIRAEYSRRNNENGGLGYPTTGEDCTEGRGCTQQFQRNPSATKNQVIAWQRSTGQAKAIIHDGILDQWIHTGAAGGTYGYPTGDPGYNPAYGFTQAFERGGGRISSNY